MKPSATMLDHHYPRRSAYPRAVLYADIGWSDVVEHPAFKDTCAIRMSVALARTGMLIPGASMRAKAGTIIGKPIEPSQAKLSRILRKQWGEPEQFSSGEDAVAGIGRRKGVVSFFRIDGTGQGHIDFVFPSDTGFPECAMACQFSAKEIWFWPLQ